MSTASIYETNSSSADDMQKLGARLGQKLKGGEVIELIGDVGSGKTTFVRGLAVGMGSSDRVQSPTFTLSRLYKSQDFTLHHFDFYRLEDAGLIANELSEVLARPDAAVVIEWSELIKELLPMDRLRVHFKVNEDGRDLLFEATGEKYRQLLEAIR